MEIAVVGPIQSSKAKVGDKFAIQLATALVINGAEILPAGTPGEGEVVHAQKKTFLTNRPGELIVAARYLELAGARYRLRGFQLGRTGGTTTIVTQSNVVPMAQNITIQAGSRATAKIAGPCSFVFKQ